MNNRIEYSAWERDNYHSRWLSDGGAYVRVGSSHSGGIVVVEFADDPFTKVDRIMHRGVKGFAKARRVYEQAYRLNHTPEVA